MTKWEYKLVDTSEGRETLYWEGEINACGNDGWELVSVCVNNAAVIPNPRSRLITTHQAYFKRPKTD